MTKLNKWIIINCLISFLMFLFILLKNIGVSGGDLATYTLNLIFGFVQIVAVLILVRKKERGYLRVIIFIMLFQLIETLIVMCLGDYINTFFNSNF